MRGDGDGWTVCGQGHKHWGRHGAAGLLVRHAEVAAAWVLLQERAWWSQHGNTWGLPGGARDSHESAVEAAVREAVEETALDPAALHHAGEWVDDHGGWAYTTVVVDAAERLAVRAATRESSAVRWVRRDEVGTLPLHPGFAQTWPVISRAW